jgi:hypothetical protein
LSDSADHCGARHRLDIPVVEDRRRAEIIPVSLQRFADSEANAARMIGGASAGPRKNEEFSSQGMPIKASRIFIPFRLFRALCWRFQEKACTAEDRSSLKAAKS